MFLYTFLFAIAILADQALAGCMISKQKCEPSKWLNKCPKGIPKKWACLDPKIKFPTVECITKDLKACGTLEKNPVLLYSFAATTVEVRTQVRDVLKPRPVMFNDALPDDWHNKIKNTERFGLVQGKIKDPNADKRYDAYVERFSAALTKAAKGEVIMVTKKRESDFGGSGAYSMPDPKTAKKNVWRTFEFPIAQRNPAVTRVVSYALEEDPLVKVIDFEPRKKGDMLPMPSFPDPPLPKLSPTSTSSMSSKVPKSTAKPSPTSKPGSSKPGSSKPGSSKPGSSKSKPKNSRKKKTSRRSRIERRQEVLDVLEDA